MNIATINSLKKIAVIDDSPIGRDSIADLVEDADLSPIIIDKKLKDIYSSLKYIKSVSDGAIFDHKLKPRNYAGFDGAEAVAKFYDQKFPSLLITTLSHSDVEIRPLKRKIPVVLGFDTDGELIRKGFEVCIEEFKDIYLPSRKPRNTLVRIIETENDLAYITIPAWDSNLKVKLPFDLIMHDIKTVKIKEGLRLFADVNIGAKSDEDLFFENFSVATNPSGKYAKFLHS